MTDLYKFQTDCEECGTGLEFSESEPEGNDIIETWVCEKCDNYYRATYALTEVKKVDKK